MDVEAIPMWLAGIEPSRVRADLRDRLITYKRWVRKVVYEAFARETGVVTTASTAATPTHSPNSLTLEHIEHMALAVAQLAHEQRAFEQHVDTRLVPLQTEIVEQRAAVMGRLDQAAVVVVGLLRRMTAVEGLVAVGEAISDAQAAEISQLVRAIAGELAERGVGKNPYQAVFGELYRRFHVSSYHNIPVHRFSEVMAWLRAYQKTLDAHGDDSDAKS